MKLMMYIGNDLIEAIPLEPGRISKPGYVGHIKRIMKVKHKELIQQCPEKVEFLIFEPNPVNDRVIRKQGDKPDS
jgi:hypothetical protein